MSGMRGRLRTSFMFRSICLCSKHFTVGRLGQAAALYSFMILLSFFNRDFNSSLASEISLVS